MSARGSYFWPSTRQRLQGSAVAAGATCAWSRWRGAIGLPGCSRRPMRCLVPTARSGNVPGGQEFIPPVPKVSVGGVVAWRALWRDSRGAGAARKRDSEPLRHEGEVSKGWFAGVSLGHEGPSDPSREEASVHARGKRPQGAVSDPSCLIGAAQSIVWVRRTPAAPAHRC